MNTEEILQVIARMGDRMEQEKEFLTDLDNAIADGDHGINMAKGFAAVKAKLDGMKGQKLGNVLKTVGMTLVSAVGGSAGPLYGTAFMRAGMVMADKESMDINDFLSCLKAATDGVMMRGRSAYGEKTMLDSMIPALDAMQKANAEGCSSADDAQDNAQDDAQDDAQKGIRSAARAVLEAGVKAAQSGVEFTKTIAATKGRASYIGERSIGHQDPGATSFTDLLEVIAQALQG